MNMRACFNYGMHVRSDLVHYVESSILPRYRDFDRAHNETHIRRVIENSLRLAATREVDIDMVYAIAAFHDLGLPQGRETHHLTSATIAREDAYLNTLFSEEQIATIAEAIEDHRASSDHEPRSIYGCIIAEADRDIDPQTILRRCLDHALAHHERSSEEEIVAICLRHLHEKYAEGGYLRLYLDDSPNRQGLETLRRMIGNGEAEQILQSMYNNR